MCVIVINFPLQNVEDGYQFNILSVVQGTVVFPLLISVLQDESEWMSPHTFNPAHFLDDKGKFVKRDAFMPFSAGM